MSRVARSTGYGGPGGELLHISQHTVPWPGLDAPVRIAQLTDVHVGWSTPFGLLQRAVQAASEADVVVFTGDSVNLHASGARRFAALLAEVDRPKLAVLGNHDHYAGAARVSAIFEEAGVRVLRNASTTVGELVIVGVDDGRTHHADPELAFQDVPPEARAGALVLTHHPPDADAIAVIGGRLVLAGHTHGGQVRLGKVSEVWFSRILRQPYVHGWYDVGEAGLYVCAGLGHAPFRVGVPPEVAVFTLVPSG